MFKIQKNLTQDIESLQNRIKDYSEAWTTQDGEPDWRAIKKLYANEDLLHYDAVTPHSFANVSEMKTAFAQMQQTLNMKSLELKPRNDLNVFRRGDLVWTTVLHDIVAQLEGGKELKLVQRQTGIWEERDGNWVMIHEHLSAPSQVETEVLEFIDNWGEAWSPKENAAEFTRASIEPFYLQSDELLGFDFTDAESRTVFKGVQIHHDTWEAFVRDYDYWTFTPVKESIRVYPQSENAAAVTLYVDNYGKKPDGKEFNARAHATLLLEKRDGNWIIVHENIWGPVNEQ